MSLCRALFASAAILWDGAVQAQTAEAELRAAEERLAGALLASDVDAFERLLAADFVLRGTPDLPRAAWIENARILCWGDQFAVDDFRVAGATADTAIVTLVLTTDQDPATCEPATVRSLITDIWRRTDDGWQLALRHTGPAGSSLEVQFAKAAPPPPLFEGSAELSLVSTGGNSDTESLGVGSVLFWRPGRWTSEVQVSFIRSEASGVATARALVAAARQARVLSPRIDAFGRVEYLANEFAGIEHRTTVDAGLGWKPLASAAHTLRLDAGIGYSHEQRPDDDLSSALANVAGVYRWQRSRAASVDNAVLFTASLARAADWRLRNTLALMMAITRLLSVKLAHDLKYVNAPAAGFRKADRSLSAALVAKF